MKRLLILASFGVAGAANALLIDDFSTGPYSTSLTAPGSSVNGFQAATVPGATRTTRLMVQTNPFLTPVTLQIGGGLAISDSGTQADSMVRLGYGYENNGSGVPIIDPMSLNLSSFNAFKIAFRSNDLNNAIKVSVVTMVGSTMNVSTALATAPGGNQSSAFDVFVNFSSFTGTANFADADVIVFEFDNLPSGDFALGSLEAVPEPATMIALAGGVAALAARRRRKA